MTVAVAVVLAILLVMALIVCHSGNWDGALAEEPYELVAQPCLDEATDTMIRNIAHDAVALSFRAYVQRLFETWMREETPDQRERVQRGMEKAIRAYLYSQQAIDKWRGTCP